MEWLAIVQVSLGLDLGFHGNFYALLWVGVGW